MYLNKIYVVGMGMGITLQHPVGMDMDMGISFENRYG